jgi:hypothetical protein
LLSALRAVWHLDRGAETYFTRFVPSAVTFNPAVPYSW